MYRHLVVAGRSLKHLAGPIHPDFDNLSCSSIIILPSPVCLTHSFHALHGMKDSHALRDGTQSVPSKRSHAEHGNEEEAENGTKPL